MADAEKYAEEDRQRREEAEVRNRGESLAYTTEKFLAENSDKVPDDIRSEVEAAIADLKRALEGTDTEAVKTASEHAAQVSQKMGTAIYAQAQAENAQAGGSGEAEADQDDDVVEAEIVDDDKPADEEGSGA
jgi:molecular chaperone DnaK